MAEQVLHNGLTSDRWNRFPIKQRLQMIESEFARAHALLAESRDRISARNCYQRARELILWTLGDPLVQQSSQLAVRVLETVMESIDKKEFEKENLFSLTRHALELDQLFFDVSSDPRLLSFPK